MAYYLFLFAYMVLVQYAFRNTKGKEVYKMIITFLPLFFYGAMRVSCGDYEIYEQYNSWVRTTSSNITDVIERMEPGYAYLNKLLPYRWIIVISTLLSCYAYGFFITKLVPQKYRWFSLFLFFIVADVTFYFAFSSIRNSIAISILLIYISHRLTNYRINSNIIKELVILTIVTSFASVFHASAAFFFPLTFLATLDKGFTNIEFAIWLTILVLFWIVPVDTIIDTNILVSNDYFSRYEDYVEVKQEAGFMAKIGATAFAILCLVNMRKNKNQGIELLMSRVMLFYVYSYMLGSLNMRISYYFIPFAIVYLTCIYINRDRTIWARVLLYYAIVFLFYASFVAGNFASPVFSPFVIYKISWF